MGMFKQYEVKIEANFPIQGEFCRKNRRAPRAVAHRVPRCQISSNQSTSIGSLLINNAGGISTSALSCPVLCCNVSTLPPFFAPSPFGMYT